MGHDCHDYTWDSQCFLFFPQVSIYYVHFWRSKRSKLFLVKGKCTVSTKVFSYKVWGNSYWAKAISVCVASYKLLEICALNTWMYTYRKCFELIIIMCILHNLTFPLCVFRSKSKFLKQCCCSSDFYCGNRCCGGYTGGNFVLLCSCLSTI